VLERAMAFDEVLRFVNELSNKIDLQTTIDDAVLLYKLFHRRISRPGAVSARVRAYFDC
jgi:hypothetical protein